MIHSPRDNATISFKQNPFATRWTQPEACLFLFPPENSIEQVLDQLQQQQGWGQIVGPHGSGKSTLLASLKPALEKRGQRLALYYLHQGQRQLPMKWSDNLLQDATQVIVDGFEQLSKFSQYRIKRYCRKFNKGLLITTHQSLGFADLIHLQPDIVTALRVVAHLQRNHSEIICADDVRRHYRHHSQNLRELLFSLYDLFEKRRLETDARSELV